MFLLLLSEDNVTLKLTTQSVNLQVYNLNGNLTKEGYNTINLVSFTHNFCNGIVT